MWRRAGGAVMATCLCGGAMYAYQSDSPMSYTTRKLYRRGEEKARSGNLSQAEREWRQALDQQVRDDGTDGSAPAPSKETVFLTSKLAHFYRDNGQWKAAEQYFKAEIRQLLARGLQPRDTEIIQCTLLLCDIYEETRQKEFAEKGYQFCASNARLTNNNALLVRCLERQAKYMLRQGKAKVALPLLEEGMELLNDSQEAELLLSHLSCANQMLGRREDAEKHGRAALEIALQTNSENTSFLIYNLAMINEEMGYSERAQTLMRQALREAKSRGDAHIEGLSQRAIQGSTTQTG